MKIDLTAKELDDLIQALSEKMMEMEDDGRDGAAAHLEPIMRKLRQARA